MFKLYCRIFQLLMKIGFYIIPMKEPIRIEGAGCIKKIKDILQSHHCHKPLLISGPTITKLGLFEPVLANNPEIVVYSGAINEPTDVQVEEARQVYLDNHCDCLIAFGGGSPIDLCKAVGARLVCPNKSVKKLQGIMKVRKKIPLLIAVPTTAGTGSERTIAAVITCAHKKPINDPCLMPDYALLDPLLTLNLGHDMTLNTALDALTHALEAYLNTTYQTKQTRQDAIEAVRLIYTSLEPCLEDPNNIDYRLNLLIASYLAGAAFTRNCVGYVHALGHAMGSIYHISHGKMMGMLLLPVLKSYPEDTQICLEALYKDVGGKENSIYQWLEKIVPKADFSFIQEADIEKIAILASREANPLYPVPCIYNRKDLHNFIKKL